MASLGEELRAAREARHLSISEVSEQIHIRSIYLQAIEEENWSSIAAPVYVRGFIRTYARFLGCDAEEAVAQFNGIASSTPAASAQPVASGQSKAWVQPAWWWIGGALLAFLVIWVGYNYYKQQQAAQAVIMAEASASPEASAVPVSRRGHAQSQLTEASKGITIKVVQRSWLRVVVDGRTLMEGMFDPGVEREFPGKTALLRVGNGAGVEVWVKGKDVGALGRQGEVAERTFNLAE